MPKRILSISYDQALLETRQALLEQRGYSVTSVRGFTQAIAYCKSKDFDLFVLGHAITIMLMRPFCRSWGDSGR